MGRTKSPAKRTLQSVDKALTLLWSFDDSHPELGVVELSRKVGLNPSTVSRLLSSLVHGGVVEYDESTGRYRLGIGLTRLASLVSGRLDLRTLARPHLEAIVAATQETASLTVFAGGQAATIDFVPSPRLVISVAELGRPGPVHATSVGKLLLAFQAEKVQERALAADLPRFTSRTVVDPTLLRAELRLIREQGFATAEEERDRELNAIAVPVCGLQNHVVAALGVQGPAHRFRRPVMLQALPALTKEAEALSTELGASTVRTIGS